PFLYMLDRPFLELDRVFLLRDLLHRLPPKSNVNCTSPLEDYLSGEAQTNIKIIMAKNIKSRGSSIAIAMAVLFTATSASAFTFTTGGTAVAGEGLKSSVLGAITTDFNSGLSNPANYTGGGVKHGSVVNQWASPPADTSNYFTVGPSTSSTGTVSFGFLASYFGYYGGSPDTWNSLQLLNNNVVIRTLSGNELAGIAGVQPNGDWSVGRYWNIFADNSTEYFNSVKFISTINAFETDNHAVLPVPEPETYAMFLAGLGLMGFMVRRRRTA
ncbi:MAG: PEP-CTERM sorting domain-containing protein, partial [Nitrosospira sp.]|nr:PEP-CTERM sorting domain-containing protein [Nitrosospira sp.]